MIFRKLIIKLGYKRLSLYYVTNLVYIRLTYVQQLINLESIYKCVKKKFYREIEWQ